MTYDDALITAINAADDARTAAADFEGMDDEQPQFGSFTAYYRDRANMYAQIAQAWAAIAQAMTTRNRELMGAGR